MLSKIKDYLKHTPLYPMLRVMAVKAAQPGAVRAWNEAGRPAPPPHTIKQQVLRELAARYGTRTLVETGTYYGDMVAAMLPYFDRIYSIELSTELHEKAVRRFRRSRKVTLVQGDSGQAIAEVASELEGPTLFWLDGHYSGGETAQGDADTPVLAELALILGRDERDVIVIDDARLFGTDPGYPELAEVIAFVEARDPSREISVELDSIRITPRRS